MQEAVIESPEADEVDAGSPEQVNAIDVALTDLEEHACDLWQHVTHIKNLKENGHFKYLSKATRNRLMEEMINKAGIVEDMTKVAFKLLKKVKREKPSEDVIDALIGAGNTDRHAIEAVIHKFPLKRPTP